jgi:hypothetical protein
MPFGDAIHLLLHRAGIGVDVEGDHADIGRSPVKATKLTSSSSFREVTQIHESDAALSSAPT